MWGVLKDGITMFSFFIAVLKDCNYDECFSCYNETDHLKLRPSVQDIEYKQKEIVCLYPVRDTFNNLGR